MRNQRILFAIHEKDRFKWFLKRRHYFQSRVQCSIPYCPHHPKGLFVPVKFPGRLGRTVFLCEASHAHCDRCYYKLKSSWISYISNTAVRKKKCVLCRKILNCVRIRQTHPYNLRSVTKLKNNPTKIQETTNNTPSKNDQELLFFYSFFVYKPIQTPSN